MKAFWENSDRFWYIKNESINTEKAKDIRMYHLIRWFQKALHHNTEEASSIYDDVMQHHFYADSIVRFTSILRDGFAYLFLIMQLADGVMDVSMFIICRIWKLDHQNCGKLYVFKKDQLWDFHVPQLC